MTTETSPRDVPVPTEPATCPLCGPAPSKALFRATDRLHGTQGAYGYHQCQICDTVFMNPRVRPEAAMLVYPSTYQPHAKSYVRSQRTLATRAMRWLRGTNLPHQLTRSLGSASRVLDVGCGAGEFLDEIRSQVGCQVSGIDLSEAAVEHARTALGIDTFCGQLSDVPWPNETFDLVTCWWSLEHMPDPDRALNKIRDLLKPDGYVLIAVPNARSLMARLFKDRWYHLDCPRHYHLWTPNSLRRMVERHGLTHQSTNFDKSPWGLLGSLQYSVFGDNHRPEVADRLRGNVKLAPLFLPATFALGVAKYSDTMVLLAQRKAA